MTRLVPPRLGGHDAWAACVAEFGGDHMDGSGQHGPVETTPGAFRAYVEDRLLQADPAQEPPAGRVHCSYRWIVDDTVSDTSGDVAFDTAGPEVLGFVAVRHRLNDWLLEQGGHVGYAIRPSRRREGHATRALAQALGLAVRLGIERVLVTCDDDNVGSARTIEANGGVLEDVRSGKRRYWITPDR